jgi:hypothetical protein
MKSIIQESLNVLKSAEIASAASISPSATWSSYHVALVPYKESFDNKLNIGRVPFVNLSSIQVNYEVVAEPDSGSMRNTLISVDAYVRNSVNSTEEQYFKLSRLVRAICSAFQKNTFLGIIETTIQEPSALPVCLATRIIFTCESSNDSDFSEGDI